MVNIFEAANKDGAIWPQSRDNQYSFQTLFTILITAHQRQQLQHCMLQVAWRDASQVLNTKLLQEETENPCAKCLLNVGELNMFVDL